MTDRLTRTVARALYRVVTCLALPLAFAYFYWRGRREPAYREGWRQRLGFGAPLAGRPLWLHAASVGEAGLAEPLLRALHARHPERPIIVTTFTPTGAARVQARLGDIVSHRYLPLDSAGATRRFMRRVAPCCGIIIETELWPNLLQAAARADVPILLANASISERSARRYGNRLLAPLLRSTLADIAAIGAASDAHAARFAALGARHDSVCVTGNLKYDLAPDAAVGEQGVALRAAWQAQHRPVWVAASTHEGEEALVLAAHRALLRRHSTALLIIAPRHPQRFAAVTELLTTQHWRFARHADGTAIDAATAVVLGDTLGDVPRFYAAADVAFVGGSLVPGIGGHNVLETALLARPLIVGPHVSEWRDIIEVLVAEGGGVVADTPDALAQQLTRWFDAADSIVAAGLQARKAAQARQGALMRTLRMLDGIVANG